MNQNKPSEKIENDVHVSSAQENSIGDVQKYSPYNKSEDVVELDPNFKAPKDLLDAQELANLLDTAVKVPFINFRVGLDFLIGLIPGVGDTIMLLASLRIVHYGHKLGLPSALMYKMMKNALIDYGLGFVPILGDIVDMFFKANQRNVRIIESWWVSQNKAQIDALARHQYEEWQKEQEKQE